MDTPAQFHKYAVDCETMAKMSRDPETQAVWKRMAERWLLCAKLAEDQDMVQPQSRIADRLTIGPQKGRPSSRRAAFDPTLGYPARGPASWRRRSEFPM